MTEAMELTDGLVNLVSGMGTSRDKAATGSYVYTALTTAQAQTAYLASALVRRVIDLPAEDSAREWRVWQSKGADISKIEALEKSLGLQGKLIQAKRAARLTGRGAILIGTGERDLTMPLDPARQKGIKYLTVLAKDDFAPMEWGVDATRPDFGQPIMWSVNGLQVHPSRLCVFYGVQPLPGISLRMQDDASVLSGLLESIQRVDSVANNINALVFEAKVDVLRIPNFTLNMAQKGTVYANQVLQRLTLAATGKGVSGTLVTDKEEEYEQKSASFASLPDILDRSMQLVSAESGIPMTILFGMSPGGLNSTGESDTRHYYDRVHVEQANINTPALYVLDECLIWAALGSRPEDLFYLWNPLWQMTEDQKATVSEKLVNTMSKVRAMGIMEHEALADVTVNALTEIGSFPGIEAKYEEYGGAAEEDVPEEVMPGGEDTVEGDTAPGGDA